MVSLVYQLHSSIDTALTNSILSEPQKVKDEDSPMDCGMQKVEYLNRLSEENGNTRDSSLREKCNGVMGVPITFLDKYSPDQFEILGMCENLDLYGLKTRVYSSEECRQRYLELFGKRGTYDLNAAGVINGIKTYQRILIKRRGCK